MTQSELVVSNPKVMLGKPTIRGTRITVELILEKLAAGETEAQILEAHPRLTKAAIQAALAFAVQALRSDMVYPIPSNAPRRCDSLPTKALTDRSSKSSVATGTMWSTSLRYC
jgi:uncharacterized protein (DUF433 family)